MFDEGPDLDYEEMYGPLEEHVDCETGERWYRHPVTGKKVWLD